MSGVDIFLSGPERIRQLNDSEFGSIYALFMEQHKSLVVPGTYDQRLAEEHPHGVKRWAVRINEGENAGQAVFILNMPRAILELARIITEERLIRHFRHIADGVLADMVVNRSAYQSIWVSYGEYAVWERQLINRQNRTMQLTAESTAQSERQKPSRDEVLRYRAEWAQQLTTRLITPITPTEIVEDGIELFGKRYGCTDMDGIYNMLVRFGSKLLFATNYDMDPSKPYSFLLAYSELQGVHTIGGRDIPCFSFGLTMASSPALAPDMREWSILPQSPHA